MTNKEYLKETYKLAASCSDDPRTQVSALIVKDGKEIGRGANSFPLLVKKLPERLERPTKYQFIEHGERNSIYMAAKLGYSTKYATMYTQAMPCSDCARAIVQAGITKLVLHKQAKEKFDKTKWGESTLTGQKILEEAKVEIEYYDGPIGEVEILREGIKWMP